MYFSVAIGFSVVLLLAYLGKTDISWLNGMIPLFPVFTMIGQISIYLSKADDMQVKEAAIVGLISIVPFTLYFLSVVFLTDTLGFPKAAVVGVILWCLVASCIVFFKQQAV